jgi:hypothetical protein
MLLGMRNQTSVNSDNLDSTLYGLKKLIEKEIGREEVLEVITREVEKLIKVMEQSI